MFIVDPAAQSRTTAKIILAPDTLSLVQFPIHFPEIEIFTLPNLSINNNDF